MIFVKKIKDNQLSISRIFLSNRYLIKYLSIKQKLREVKYIYEMMIGRRDVNKKRIN